MQCEETVSFILSVLGGVILFAAGSAIGGSITATSYQKKAVQLGYAYHHPETGNWMWKTNSVNLEK